MNWLRFAWSGTTRVPTALLVAFLLLSALTWIPDDLAGVRGIVFVACVVFIVRAFILQLRRE